MKSKLVFSVTLALIAAMLLSNLAFAAVWTDQPDYSPGSVVTISGDNSDGAGFLPGETVHVDVAGPNGYTDYCDAVAGDYGAWSCQVTLWDGELAVGGYTYTAVSQNSGVSQSGTFTDGQLTVTGNVKDTNNNLLSGATVKCTSGCNTVEQVSTDANGDYAFTGGKKLNIASSPVDITLTASAENCTSQSQTFNVSNGGTFTEKNFTLTCTSGNSAPNVGTISGDSPVDEGSSHSYTSNASDPDGDTLSYTWSVSSGNASIASGQGTNSVTLDFGDGPSTVVLHLVINDGHEDSVSPTDKSITVNNVAPTASLGNNSPVDEGSAVTVSFSGQYDPSSADTSAGFHYAFSCTNGDLSGAAYASSGIGASTSCTFYDNSTYTVKGRIIDKDGGYSEYTTNVVVNNVAPSITSVVAGAAASCGSDNSITVNFTDPGTLDTWSASINWGDGNTESINSVTTGFGASHTYVHAGIYTVTVTVTDDDSGVSAPKTAQVTLNYDLSGILQPVNPGPPNSIFKYGSTIPVKVQVKDCDGSYPSDLTLKVTWQLLSSGTPSGDISEPYSTSAADTGNTMRFTGSPDYQYIFNLASKSFPDGTATYRIYVTISITNQKVSADIGMKSK